MFQRHLDRFHNALQRLLQRFENFVATQHKTAGHAFGQVAALDLQLTNLAARIGRANLMLDAFRGGFTDQRAVVAPDIAHDRVIEPVAADAGGG